MKIILKNGYVFDPVNKINGEIMDIFIKDGKIVEEVDEKDAKIIDCKGKVVMPGAIDIHSHIAGGKVNSGRILRPEDHRRFFLRRRFKNGIFFRSGAGFSVPSTRITGYLYAKMGYTMAFTPALPPLMARHTHEELSSIPIIDKGALTLMGNNWFVMKYLKEGNIEKCAAFVAWLLRSVRGYAIKVVNPGGGEAWGWGKNVTSLEDRVPYFDVTPREIIEGLMKVNEMLNLPHSEHLHTINLGRVGNYETTIKTMEIAKGLENKERQVLQITHAQFHSYGGENWKNFESKAHEIAKVVNKMKNVAIDVGFVTLDPTTTMTADGPMEYYLSSLTHLKWTNKDIELETAPGVTPYNYSPKSAVSSVQWAIGLELALLVEDPWRVMLTTDHPNGGPFIRYPRIIAWLMSKKYREDFMKKMNKAVEKRAIISSLDREYSLYEIAIITRAAQAKSLGLKEKGHLGIGADADVAVYNLNPEELDTNDYEKIEKAFSNAYVTIKGGEIVVRDGEVVNEIYGKTYYVDAEVEEELMRDVERDLDYYFKRFYSVNLANYPVGLNYLTNPVKIARKIEKVKVIK